MMSGCGDGDEYGNELWRVEYGELVRLNDRTSERRLRTHDGGS